MPKNDENKDYTSIVQRRINRQVGMDARLVLRDFYLIFGRSSGVTFKEVLNPKSGEKYEKLDRCPMSHLGVAKVIVRELKNLQITKNKMEYEPYILWCTILKEVKKNRQNATIFWLRDNLPQLIKEYQNFGEYRILKLLKKDSTVRHSPTGNILKNDGISHRLNRSKFDDTKLWCIITGIEWKISELELVEDPSTN